MNVSKIYEGWKNSKFPAKHLKAVIKQTSKERMLICKSCELCSLNVEKTYRPDVHCTDCGCILSAKTACLTCKCPKDKWMPVITEEEKNKIDEYE